MQGIRFFIPILPPHPNKEKTWTDVGFSYLRAFASLAEVRAIPTNPVGDFSLEIPEDLAPAFVRHLKENYVNVVVGMEFLRKLWTQGVPNIAIASALPKEPTPQELKALSKYQYVIDVDPTQTLSEYGVSSFHIPADAEALWTAFRGLLETEGAEAKA